MTGGSPAAQAVAAVTQGNAGMPDGQTAKTGAQADGQTDLQSLFAAILNGQKGTGGAKIAAAADAKGDAGEGAGQEGETGDAAAVPPGLVLQLLARLIAGGNATGKTTDGQGANVSDILGVLGQSGGSPSKENGDLEGTISLKDMTATLESLLSGAAENAVEPALAAKLQELLGALKQMNPAKLMPAGAGSGKSNDATAGRPNIAAVLNALASRPGGDGPQAQDAHLAASQTAGGENGRPNGSPQGQGPHAAATGAGTAVSESQATPLKDFLDTLSLTERARLAAAIRHLAANGDTDPSAKQALSQHTLSQQAGSAASAIGSQRTNIQWIGPGTSNSTDPQQKAVQASGQLENLAKEMQIRVHNNGGKPTSGQLLNAETAASAFAARLAGNGTAAGTGGNGDGGTSVAFNPNQLAQATQGQAGQAPTVPGQNPAGQISVQPTQLPGQGLPQFQSFPGAAALSGAGTAGNENDGFFTANEGTTAGAPNSLPQPGSLQSLDSSLARIARAPMTPQAPPAQVAMHITKAVEQGLNRFVIQLQPADLGKVEVDMNMDDDGRLQAVVRADRPETLHLLERDARSLQQALASAGVKADSGSLSFSLNQRGEDGGNQAAGKGASSGTPGTASEDGMDSSEPALHRRHDGQLDVWT